MSFEDEEMSYCPNQESMDMLNLLSFFPIPS